MLGSDHRRNVQGDRQKRAETFFSPRAVARAIGVSESSLKRWCDAGHIKAQKTAGGHRRMTKADVVTFVRDSVHNLVDPVAIGLPNINTVQVLNPLDASRQLFDAIVAGDETQCKAILAQCFVSGHEISEIFDQVISPTFQRVGDMWRSGNLDIYQERLGCVMCLKACDELSSFIAPPKPGALTAVGGSPEGDQYMLPTTGAELVLKSQGWNARSLGSDLPFSSLSEAAENYRPDLIWLSTSSINDEAIFISQFNRFVESLSPGTLVVLGGNALTPSIRSQIGNATCCDNFSQLTATVRGIKPRLDTPTSGINLGATPSQIGQSNNIVG